MKFINIAGISIVTILLLSGCNHSTPEKTESNSNDKVILQEKEQAPVKQESAPAQVDAPIEIKSSKNPNAAGGTNANAAGNAAGQGQPDKYGRTPGDPHYGHDHPIQQAPPQGTQQQQISPQQINPQQIKPPANTATPQQGKPDKFGRMPGDEHYGHDHQ